MCGLNFDVYLFVSVPKAFNCYGYHCSVFLLYTSTYINDMSLFSK